jgi:DNA replication ATP-dependent helicase Dna2
VVSKPRSLAAIQEAFLSYTRVRLFTGFGVSMLKHLADQHSDSVAQLTYQYRMHEDICQLSNDVVYKGKLKCANDEVRWRRLELKGFPENIPSINRAPPGEWLIRAIDPSNPVIFVNTDKMGTATDTNEADSIIPHERTSGGGNHGNIVNDVEAEVVRLLVGGLLGCGLDASSIGVICPFRAQVRTHFALHRL